MAAPVVAGLAALIREYYPGLSAKAVKDIILKSAVRQDGLGKYCATGGIVNAYNALSLAVAYSATAGKELDHRRAGDPD